jgi:hypothetical protein
MNAAHQRPNRPKGLRTSAILHSISDQCTDGKISIRDFTAMMGDRAFALIILVFSLPNSLPIPGIPGFSTITGLPILFISLQMLLGRDVIWLPKWVANKQFNMQTIKKVLNKAIPYVIKLEKYLKPRWSLVLSPIGECLVGFCIAMLTLLLVLPIPGGNFLPGLSITILALSFLEKDGLWTACGVLISIISFYVMFEAISKFIGWLLS